MLDCGQPICVTHATTENLEADEDGSATVVLGAAGDREIGIWEIEPGVTTDIEVDEVFIVLAGSATISVDGQPDVLIGQGDVVRLDEGTATTWTVHARLRKVYLVDGSA